MAGSAGTSGTGRRIPSSRPSLGLVFGGGLDLETGIAGAPIGSSADLRNVHLRRGRIQLRKGLVQASTYGAARPVAGVAAESEGAGVVITFNDATLEVRIWRTEGDGTDPQLLGLWFTALASGGEPRFHMAEYGGRVFMAHDEPLIDRRAPTVYYDIEDDSVLPLLADWGTEITSTTGLGTWAAVGQKVIKFRGVKEYLSYIIGWGYGSAIEDRPELVRASIPGLISDDTLLPEFNIEHYWIVGARRVPVLTCVPAGDVLLAIKRAEAARIIGESWLDFGILDADLQFGVEAGRLAIHHRGACYAWSLEGPRVSKGGPFEDLSLPLDIGGPSPDDLVAEGALEDAFACYLPDKRELWFVFGQRVYALSVRDPSNLAWSYHEFPIVLTAGFILYGLDSAIPTEPPAGYPDYDSTNVAVAGVSGTTWTHVGEAGDETVDVYIRPAGGIWTRNRSTGIGPSPQQIDVVELEYGKSHDTAARHRYGPTPAVGYEGDDPDAWTAGTAAASKGVFVTSIPAPTALTAVWARTGAAAEEIELNWTDPAGTAGMARRVLRDGVPIADLAAGIVTYTNTDADADPIAGETSYDYQVRYYTAAIEGIEAEVTVWSGPLAPTGAGIFDAVACSYTPEWNLGQAGVATEIYDDYAGGGLVLQKTSPVDATQDTVLHGAEIVCEGGGVMGPVNLEIRHKLTSFAVDDFSRNVVIMGLQLCDVCT